MNIYYKENLTDKEKYIDFCNQNSNVPLFYQPWWLDIMVNHQWDVVVSLDAGSKILAALPYAITKKYGLKFILQPKLTPYLGILYNKPRDLSKLSSIYSFENKHSKILIEQLPKSVIYQQLQSNIDFTNWYSFYNSGYVQSTRYTYILKNIKNHDYIYNGFTNTLKRQIKEGYTDINIEETQDIWIVFELMKNWFKYSGIKWGLDKSVLEKLDIELKNRNMRDILIARNKEGKVVSGAYIVRDLQKAYLLGLGTDRDLDTSNSTKTILWEAIKKSSGHVDIFDFEGSMIPGVERIYRSFGGKMTPYFEIKKYKNRLIRGLFLMLNK